MPFGEAASNSYGTASASGGESHRRQDTPQQPLRSRPHIRGGTSSPGDLLFSHPHSSFDEFPYPPYSELPFTSLRRRKQGNQFVKWAMRAVLASPVVVLVFWSIGAMIFTKNVGHRSRHSTTAAARTSIRSAFRRLPETSQLGQQPLLQPLVMMPQNQFYGIPQTNMAAPAFMMAPQEIQQQQLQQQPQPVMQLQQLQMQQGYGIPQQQQALGNTANVVQPQYYANVNSNTVGVIPLMSQQDPMALQPPLQASAQQGFVFQPQPLQSASLLPPPQQLNQEPQVPPPSEQVPVVMQEQLLGAVPHGNDPMGNARSASQTHPTARGDVTVLYYDPKQTVPGPNGQLRLPTTVYDSQGNPVDLVGLAAQNQAQILIEPPLLQAQAEEPPSSRTLIQEQEIPSAQLAAPDIKKWGESTAQDQSIIISTVAVMALLVGALSARRMRNRSVLSACIENESLEDDVAYDAAYSTTLPQADGGSYNTFGGGWKGDLEKFDV